MELRYQQLHGWISNVKCIITTCSESWEEKKLWRNCRNGDETLSKIRYIVVFETINAREKILTFNARTYYSLVKMLNKDDENEKDAVKHVKNKWFAVRNLKIAKAREKKGFNVITIQWPLLRNFEKANINASIKFIHLLPFPSYYHENVLWWFCRLHSTMINRPFFGRWMRFHLEMSKSIWSIVVCTGNLFNCVVFLKHIMIH